jgi:hypothetical protein
VSNPSTVRPRHALRDVDPDVEPAPVVEPPAGCNLAGCKAVPEWRGLCAAHRQTHRGLADAAAPKEEK